MIEKLTEEIKHRGGKQQDRVRDQLIQLAEKDMEKQQLLKQHNLRGPLYERTKQDEQLLEKLQAENHDLLDHI